MEDLHIHERRSLTGMSAQEKAFALISVFEGCRLSAYQDGGGVWTIGIGHTVGVKAGDTCTTDQAIQWFRSDSQKLFGVVKDFGEWAQAAYVSFAYNAGRAALQLVIEGKASLIHFIHDRHGNVEPGLVTRRALESALINS
jgi:lysozyme